MLHVQSSFTSADTESMDIATGLHSVTTEPQVQVHVLARPWSSLKCNGLLFKHIIMLLAKWYHYVQHYKLLLPCTGL